MPANLDRQSDVGYSRSSTALSCLSCRFGRSLNLNLDRKSSRFSAALVAVFLLTACCNALDAPTPTVTPAQVAQSVDEPAALEAVTPTQSVGEVVVFASPAFCMSPTSRPQVDTIVDLKNAHAGAADFIHVEIYDNPHEILGDLTKAVFSPHIAVLGGSTRRQTTETSLGCSCWERTGRSRTGSKGTPRWTNSNGRCKT
jgi:hypothetical protein